MCLLFGGGHQLRKGSTRGPVLKSTNDRALVFLDGRGGREAGGVGFEVSKALVRTT